MDYYIYQHSVTRGPFSLSQLGEMWKSGVVTSEIHYWHPGYKQWQPIRGLFEPPPVPETTPQLEPKLNSAPITEPDPISVRGEGLKRNGLLLIGLLAIGGILFFRNASGYRKKGFQVTETVAKSQDEPVPVQPPSTLKPTATTVRAQQWNDVAAALVKTGATVESESGSNVMTVILPTSVSASITDYDAKRIAEMTYDRLGGASIVIVTDGSGLRLARASMWGVSGRD